MKEMKKQQLKRKSRLRFLWAAILILFILTGIFFGYVSDYYHPELKAVEALQSNQTVVVTGEDPFLFQPVEDESAIGIIFYPGGKVDEKAYAPVMQQLAKEGYHVFLAAMPFHLAVFDISAAEGIIADHPEIKEWYIAGHSLGGSMAAAYAEKHANQLDGLILLAAYSANDLTDTHLRVLSLYGDKDGILNFEKVKENEKNLPSTAETFLIEGGNHAQFGNYGFQKGDGEAEISREDQQQKTIEKIRKFIEE